MEWIKLGRDIAQDVTELDWVIIFFNFLVDYVLLDCNIT